MSLNKKVIIFFIFSLVSCISQAKPICIEKELTNNQIINIIAHERNIRDLPLPYYSESIYKIRREGCHYVVIEYGIPRRMHKHIIFKINQKGIIVDVNHGQFMNSSTLIMNSSGLKCPDEVFSTSELINIVEEARVIRDDLPKKLLNYNLNPANDTANK